MRGLRDLRLVVRVARLYYHQGRRQSEIAGQLGLTQATVSRLLEKAKEYRIVRTLVVTPPGSFAELEEFLERRFGLNLVIIDEASSDSEEAIQATIGSAGAKMLESTLKSEEVIGLSSWSSSLLSVIGQMRPLWNVENCRIVQLLGGIGNPAAEQHANHLAVQLGRLVQGEVYFLPVPGIVASKEAAEILVHDADVRKTLALFAAVTLALVGIGSLEPSALVASSGNIFTKSELESLRQMGAVGDICLRFFDINGRPIKSDLDERVIGMTLKDLQQVRRSVAICGGKKKFPAILGALRGKWINALITDLHTAERLAKA